MSRLAETIDRLQEHFTALHNERIRCNPVSPVFALEHPLGRAEVHALTKDLCEALRHEGQIVPAHALAWVTVSSETGYNFGGCEFWQSFNERIPNWAELGNRDALRSAFIRFSQLYQGAEPTGQWAAHRSLICWPITHAILPRDLQRHLCEAIYVCRHQLIGLQGADAEHIGLIIANNAASYGTRFDQFLQEHLLVGAIARRLLLGESEIDFSFRKETFDRILHDLRRISVTREWLREASRLYNHKVYIRAPNVPRKVSYDAAPKERRKDVDLRPTLILEADASGTWAPSLIPPSLMGWAQENPEVGRAVESLRYRVIGTDRARPGACLLATTPVQAVLSAFPQLDQPIIELLPRHEGLSAVLDMDCRLPACRILVFRVRGTTATLSQKPEVSPGEAYLLATQDLTIELGSSAACTDPTWRLRYLELPSTLTTSLQRDLNLAGIPVRQSTRLRPWGLLPRTWDEESDGEWITTEPISYVIERNHPFDAVSFCVDDGQVHFLECEVMVDPTVVIEDLPPGLHTLTVQTYERRGTRSGPEWHELSHGEALIRVRTPSTWAPGRISPNTLPILVSPPRPTLTDLLKGECLLTVEGIATAPVEISFEWGDGAAAATASLSILRQRAPINEDTWSQHLGVFRRKADDAWVSLGAQHAALRLTCEPLGEQRISLYVSASLVRWSVRDQMVRLICDGSHEPHVLMSSFAEPVATADIDRRLCERGLELTQSGLYVALDGDLSTGVILGAPSGTASGLRALGEQICMDALRSCDVSDLLSAIVRWEAATPLTVHARTNQKRVVNQLHAEALRRVAGDLWVELEAADPRRWSELEEAVDHPHTIHSFGYSLGRYRTKALSQDAIRHHFFETAVAYAITNNDTCLEMAWQLATTPSKSPTWTSPIAKCDVLARLVRGARLVWLGNQQASAG